MVVVKLEKKKEAWEFKRKLVDPEVMPIFSFQVVMQTTENL